MLYRCFETFETENVVVAFSNDSVFGFSIENDAFSDVSVFKSLHFGQRFQMSPFSIVFNGNTNPKTETFHSVFIRKRSNGNGALHRSSACVLSRQFQSLENTLTFLFTLPHTVRKYA